MPQRHVFASPPSDGEHVGQGILRFISSQSPPAVSPQVIDMGLVEESEPVVVARRRAHTHPIGGSGTHFITDMSALRHD